MKTRTIYTTLHASMFIWLGSLGVANLLIGNTNLGLLSLAAAAFNGWLADFNSRQISKERRHVKQTDALINRMRTVSSMFTELLSNDPQLMLDFPHGEGKEVMLIPLWDKELVEYTLNLASKPSPPEVLERVVVYLGGSWDGINSLKWEIWTRDSAKTTKVEA